MSVFDKYKPVNQSVFSKYSSQAQQPQQPQQQGNIGQSSLPFPSFPLSDPISFLKEVFKPGRLTGAYEGITGSLSSAGERFSRANKNFQQNGGNIFSNPRGGMTLLGAAGDVVMTPAMGVMGLFKPEFEETISQISQKIPDSVKEKAKELIEKIPEEDRAFIGDTFSALGLLGLPSEELAKGIAEKSVGMVDDIVEGTVKKVKNIPQELKNAERASANMEHLVNIMPKDVEEFKKLSGGISHSDWMLERGIVGDTEKMTNDLVKRWQDSYEKFNKAVGEVGDAALYKDKAVTEALGELVNHYDYIGNKMKSGIMKKRLLKMEKEGLSAQEILNIKRDFEKDIKLGYKKSPSTEAKTLLKNDRIDSEMRESLTNILEENNFDNAKELSKETQLSRLLADSMAEKSGRTGIKDALSLTDKIMIGVAPAAPKALLGLVLKKFLSGETWKAMKVKLFADLEKLKGIPEPNMRRIGLKNKMNEFKKELHGLGIKDKKVEELVKKILRERQIKVKIKNKK